MSSIKESFKKLRSKSSEENNDDIELVISSEKVVSAPTPVVINEVEHSETTLSIGDFNATKKRVSKVSTKRGSYSKYSDESRFKIGKYCSENGVANGLRKFKQTFPNLTESTARTFRAKYEKEIKIADKEDRPAIPIAAQKLGRPLLLGSIDNMVQNYLKVS